MSKKLYNILSELSPFLYAFVCIVAFVFILHICFYDETIVRIDNANVTSVVIHRDFFGNMNTKISIEDPYINNVCITSDTIPNQISGYVVTKIPAIFECSRTFYPSIE